MKRLSIAALFILLVANLATGRADAAEPAGCGTGLLEGKRITVEVQGSGPDVVLIPGLSSPRDVWGPTAARLKGALFLSKCQILPFRRHHKRGEPVGIGKTPDGLYGNRGTGINLIGTPAAALAEALV